MKSPSVPSAATRVPFAARRRRRTQTAAVVLVAWVIGLVGLARREVFVGDVRRLAERALSLSPGATYFAVEQAGVQIGFASTNLDTTTAGIEVVDDFLADIPLGSAVSRASARSIVTLSRGLALKAFDVRVTAPGVTVSSGGRTDGDSGVVYTMTTNGVPGDSQRIAVDGPILVPTLIPLVVALGQVPKVGTTVAIPTLDPQVMRQRSVSLRIAAESLFLVVDSARFDEGHNQWVAAMTDTVRAWLVHPDTTGGPGFHGWIDRQGRVVEAFQAGGITLRRMAFEMAFENWRIVRERKVAAAASAGDIVERTAIAAKVIAGRARLRELRVRLSGVDLQSYRLDGERQRLTGDTLSIVRESTQALVAAYSMNREQPRDFRERFRTELGPEPLLQSRHENIVRQAVRIVGLERTPRVIAEKLNRWVYDSLKKEVTFSVPNALAVLRSRKGDCNEHTQLYVALARAINIPARVVTGLAYVRGKFYYHAWPEVFLGNWVAVDPTFGQFPADAAHLRFAIGGLAQQADLLRLVGNLRIDVLEAK